MILTDPPYGITACAWDIKPSLAHMWDHFNRIIKPHGAIIITATQPFATDVINGNRRYFRYDLIWGKNNPTGFLNAGRMPMRQHELVLIFYKKLPDYFPQTTPGKLRRQKAGTRLPSIYIENTSVASESSQRFPTSLLLFPKDSGIGKKHPTQKPQALFEWLIQSYTRPGSLVIDPYLGSGTTAAAAITTGRKYIGIEKDPVYYAMATERIEKQVQKKTEERAA